MASFSVSPKTHKTETFDVGRLLAEVRIRRHTLPHRRFQLTITAPYSRRGSCRGGRGIGNGGFPGYHAVGGIGITISLHGALYRGPLARPIGVTLRSHAIKASSLVVVWDGRRFVESRAHVSPGRVRLRIRRGSDYAVLSRNRHHHHHHGRATVPAAYRSSAGAGTGQGLVARAALLPAVLLPAGAPSAGLGVLASH